MRLKPFQRHADNITIRTDLILIQKVPPFVKTIFSRFDLRCRRSTTAGCNDCNSDIEPFGRADRTAEQIGMWRLKHTVYCTRSDPVWPTNAPSLARLRFPVASVRGMGLNGSSGLANCVAKLLGITHYATGQYERESF